MKNIIPVIIFLFCCQSVFAQADTLPVYKRFPTVPPFRLVNVTDSSIFSKADLPEKEKLMMIMFSPDCDHCQAATRDLVRHIDLFKKVNIVMASWLDYKLVKEFYYEYGLDKFSNVMVTRDPAYFLGTFFSVKNFPSIYLYDKKGRLIKEFDGSVSFEKIAKEF